MLRRHIRIQQLTEDLLARTFTESEGFSVRNAVDSIGSSDRIIQPGRAYLFDGVDDSVSITQNAPLVSVFDDKFSFSFWFNATAIPTTGWYTIFDKPFTTHSSTFYQVTIRLTQQARIQATAWRSDTFGEHLSINTPISSISPTNWYFVSVVVDISGGEISIYLDDTYSDTFSSPVGTYANYNTGLSIGRQTNLSNPIYFYSGYLYDFRLHNTNLSAEQVSLIYNGLGAGDEYLWYKMDEGVGAISYNSAGGSDNGIMNNGLLHATLSDGRGAEFQNNFGYTENAGALIPRDERDKAFDVLGGFLQYSGRVKYDSQFLNGGAIDFDGVDDYITLGNDANLLFSDGVTDQAFTITARIEPDTNNNFRILTAGETGTNTLEFLFTINAASDFIFIMSSDGTAANRIGRAISGVTAIGGLTRFLVASYDGSGLESGISINMYDEALIQTRQDDISFSSGSYSSMQGNNQTKFVGKINNSYSNGRMRDVRVHSGVIPLSNHVAIGNGFASGNELCRLKMDEFLGNTAFNSVTTGNDGALIGAPSRVVGPLYSHLWQRNGYTNNAGVIIPRDELNQTLDVQGNPLQYDNRGYDLLPGGEVNFNPGVSPVLIRQSVPTSYTYGGALPATMSKQVETNKENNFTINNP